jgi:hypothetical protein
MNGFLHMTPGDPPLLFDLRLGVMFDWAAGADKLAPAGPFAARKDKPLDSTPVLAQAWIVATHSRLPLVS